ncbi:MAG: hypothetical protein JWO36_7054 [Myxococcales bacterium]|nr:hypothetical protein [Myxococcales bacterium]
MKHVVFAVLLTAGCNKGAEPLECARIIPGAIDRMMDSAKSELSAEAFTRVQQVAPKMKEAITRVCRDDQWPPDIIDCHRIASTQADINLCQRKLTATQRAHADKATEDVIASFNAAGSGSSVGSSSVGSAGSASAR